MILLILSFYVSSYYGFLRCPLIIVYIFGRILIGLDWIIRLVDLLADGFAGVNDLIAALVSLRPFTPNEHATFVNRR